MAEPDKNSSLNYKKLGQDELHSHVDDLLAQHKNSQSNDHELHFSKKNRIILLVIVIFVFILGLYAYLSSLNVGSNSSNVGSQSGGKLSIINDSHQHQDGEEYSHQVVDLTKLPLGDDKYSTTPKKGFVYNCNTSYNGGGAHAEGPWINRENGTWDLTKKIQVDGDVNWSQASYNSLQSEDMRIITSNGLPINHNTGTYPIATTDEAYNYDRNPASILEQSIDFSIPKNPVELSSPECVGGEVGIATTGVLIFNAFDAAGRDAVAIEVQDKCGGHPQPGGYYHYHGYSSCFKDNDDKTKHSDILGYAFDGFGIYGLRGENGKKLFSNDLDECHGHTHIINWDGQDKKMYHYHMTQDFPYSVSCFKGSPVVKALSSGEGGGQGQQPGQSPPQNSAPQPAQIPGGPPGSPRL